MSGNMDKTQVTPRFFKIDSIKKNLEDDELNIEKKIQTCKNVSKFKSKSSTKIKCRKSKISRKSRKSTKSNKSHKSAKTEESNLTNFFKTINIKKKFLLRNDFDRKHSKKFLEEKHLMLEKPILFDEIC